MLPSLPGPMSARKTLLQTSAPLRNLMIVPSWRMSDSHPAAQYVARNAVGLRAGKLQFLQIELLEADMGNGWTSERRARQAELIRAWKPWQRATGPRTPGGKIKASMNAYKGGDWLTLRELTRAVNAEIRRAKDLLESTAL